jgi:hypothetical protein
MFDYMDDMMRALAKKKTQWKEDKFFAMKSAWQKLPKNYTEVTPMTGLHIIWAHIRDPFRKLRLFRKRMDIDPEDKTTY